MSNEISFYKVQSTNTYLIDLISGWYLDEWNIPLEYTRQRFANIPNEDVIFQLILSQGSEPVATAVYIVK